MVMSEEVKSFVVRYVKSLEQLEILCVLGESEEPLSVDEIYRKVKTNKDSISGCLKYFLNEGLVILEKDHRYCLAKKYPDLARIVSELHIAYRQQLVAIVEMIYKAPRSHAEDFADAFKFRKDK